MKKIIPSLIFTAATVAGTILYIKKKFKEKNEIKLIEIEEESQENDNEQFPSQWNATKDEIAEKITEVANTIGTIVDGIKEENQLTQEKNNTEETNNVLQEEVPEIKPVDDDIPQEENHNTDVQTEEDIVEPEIIIEEKQEEIPEVKSVDDDLPQEENHNTDEQAEEDIVEPEIIIEEKQEEIPEVKPVDDDLPQEENHNTDEQAEEDIVEPEQNEPMFDSQEKEISEEEQRINDEINSIIDEIIQPQNQEEDEIIIDNIDSHKETADKEEDTKEIEKVLNDDISQLNPLEYADDTLKIVDENKREENLIDDIISSIDEEDQNQQAMHDIEQLVEDEVETIKEEDLTDEELVEKYAQQFQPITAKKIDLILKQVRLMQKSIGDCNVITLLHYIIFDNEEEKEKYAEIAKIENYEIEKGAAPNELHLINTLENNRLTLNHAILDLARNVGEFHGSYRGWAVKDTH
ncbi:MAG: hypothetical protein Q4C64_03195 [Erysipelotrichia bacterium]|nr:hypothetical protein [Erysipelotrichia bacterium]